MIQPIYQHLRTHATFALITDGLVRLKQVNVTFAWLVIGKTRKMEIFVKSVVVVKQVLWDQQTSSLVHVYLDLC